MVILTWSSAVPLVVQVVSTPLRLYRDKLLQIHVFGATGPDYTRPFPAPANPLASLMGYHSVFKCFLFARSLFLFFTILRLWQTFSMSAFFNASNFETFSVCEAT